VAGCVVVIVAMDCSLNVCVALVLSARLVAVHNSVENDVAHLFRQRFGITVDARLYQV